MENGISGMGNRIVAVIMLGILIWGGFLAYGSYRGPIGSGVPVGLTYHNPWRGIVSAGCTVAFLGFWAFLLVWNKDRFRRKPSAPPQDDV